MKDLQNITNKEDSTIDNSNLYDYSRNLILNSRKLVYHAANYAMVKRIGILDRKLLKNKAEKCTQNTVKIC
jgi:hypothetical protein